MTAVSHAIIGATISIKVPQLIPCIVLSFVTHFICDAIPHWDLGTNWRLRPKKVTGLLAILETLAAILLVFFIFKFRSPNQFVLSAGILFSLLPDWLEAPYYILMPKSPKLFYYLYKVQSLIHQKLDTPYGIYTQIMVVGIFLLISLL